MKLSELDQELSLDDIIKIIFFCFLRHVSLFEKSEKLHDRKREAY